MTERRHLELQAAEDALRQWRVEEAVGDDVFFRLLILLAHDYSKEERWPKVGELLEAVTPEYLAGPMKQHAIESPDFCATMFALAQGLVAAGAVSLEPQFFFTGTPTKA